MYKRIIGLILLSNGIVCRTRNFVPDYFFTDEFIDSKFFDEIICIDVTKSRSESSQQLFLRSIEKLMNTSQLPLSIGGGIKSLSDIKRYRSFGADRYIINQTEANNDAFVVEAIKEFGQSSIISSVNPWGDFTFSNGEKTDKTLKQRVTEIIEIRGSELMLNSTERDGTLLGLDLDTIQEISVSFELPIIVSGGIGRCSHVLDSFQIKNVTGVCTSNIYHLTTSTISTWRDQIKSKGGNVRTI